MRLNTSYLITLPPFKDNESNPIFIYASAPPPLDINEIIQIVYPNKLNITAWKWAHCGTYLVNITLTDTINSTTYAFKMTVFNEAPMFQSGSKVKN